MAITLDTVEVPGTSVGSLPPITTDGQGNLSPALWVELYNMLTRLIDRFNGLISLGNAGQASRAGNLDARYVVVTMPAAPNTEITVPIPNLGRDPVVAIAVQTDRAAHVYASSRKAWRDGLIFLKCDVASAVVTLLVW